MEPLYISKVNDLPVSPDKKILYLTKQEDVLNLVLSDQTQTRPAVANRKVILHGPSEIIATTDGSNYTVPSTEYTIQNFDSFKTYSVSVSRGTATINGNKITLAPNAALGDVYLGVNKEFSKITVRLAGVNKPKILFPYILDSIVPETFTAYLSAFSSGNGSETCVSTEYQISDKLDFSSNVQSVTATGAITSKSILSSVVNTEAYLRARYTGNLTGAGPWSEVIRFMPTNQDQPLHEDSEIRSPDEAPYSYFGSKISVSANGKRLIVTSTVVNSKGAVYVYEQEGEFWELKQKLQPADLPAGSIFGVAATISNDGEVIAAANSSTASRAGSVYIYERRDGTWTLTQTILAETSSNLDGFGDALSFSNYGVYLAVGCPYDDTTVANSGCVYLYKRGNAVWELKQKIKQQTPAGGKGYGLSVQLSPDGTYLFVGETSGARVTTTTGAVCIYTRSVEAWSLQVRLTDNAVSENGNFGYQIASNETGDLLAVSATADAGGGSVYIYTRSGITWTFQQKLQIGGVTSGSFGNSIAITPNGNRLIIAGFGYNANNGLVKLYKHSAGTYSEIQQLVNENAITGEQFGTSIGISSDGKTIIASSQRFGIPALSQEHLGKINIFR